MKTYKDTDHCGRCDKDTLQRITDSEHERDSSGDYRVCLECGWYRVGSEDWAPPMEIHFYKTKETYGCFSNFSRHPVTLNGWIWPTSEHYFQAQKFAGTHHETEIRKAKSPSEAALMGRDRDRPLRPDWEQVKDDVMRDVVRAKFKQNEGIRKILLDTGNADLVEHTANDSYWADGGDGSGKNMLGKILMEIRTELRS